MTLRDPGTPSGRGPTWFLGRPVEIDEQECWQLLADAEVGRIGFVGADGPAVLPVNHVVVDGEVVFRTAPFNSIAAAVEGARVAFEVDEIDPVTRSGWSVLVQGRAAFMDPADELPPDRDHPEPWLAGARWLHVRITPSSVTGRRILPA